MSKAAKAPAPEETKAVVAPAPAGALQVAPPAPIAEQEVVASDVLIPRLLLMQGISPLVMSRKAQLGQFVRSTTQEVLGDPEHPVDIVPIRMTSTWINFEVIDGQAQFRSMEHRGRIRDAQGNVIGSNETWDWNYKGANGGDWVRKKAISLFALVPQDIAKYEEEVERAIKAGEAPDLNRIVLPVVLTFQSTTFKHAGRKCASFFNNVKVTADKMRGRMNIVPWQYLIPLTCKEEKGKKGTYYVFDMGVQKVLKDKAVIEEAQRWAQILSTQAVKTDDGELHDEEDAGGAGASASEMEI